MRLTRTYRNLIRMTLATLLAIPAAAQSGDLPRKPLRTPSQTIEDRSRQTEHERADALTKLEKVWMDAGSPPIFILCGVSWNVVDAWGGKRVSVVQNRTPSDGSSQVTMSPGASDSQSHGGLIGGSLSPFEHLKNDMTCEDPLQIAPNIASAVMERLIEAGVDNIKSPEAMVENRARLVAAYESGGAYEALRSIFSELPSSYVLKIELSVSEPGTDAEGNPETLVRVRYDVLIPGASRAAGSGTFEARAGTSDEFLSAYADRITFDFAKVLTRVLTRRADRGELIVIKLEDADLSLTGKIQAAMKENDEERFVRLSPRGSRNVNGRNITDVEIRYRGDAFELHNALSLILPEKCGLTIRTTDAVDGCLTLKIDRLAAQRDPAEMTRWEILADPQHPQHVHLTQKLRSEYESEGRPRIGVLVNRGLVEADLAGEAGQALRNMANRNQWNMLAYARPRGGGVDGEALDTEAMLQAIRSELQNYGFVVVDPEHVRGRIAKEATDQAQIQDEAEIETAIRRLDTADLVLKCVGRKLGGEPAQYKYTFNVLRNADGVIPASAMESILASDFTGGRDPLERLAKQATARIVDKLWSNWTPPRRILLRVTGAASQDAVLAVREALEIHIRGGFRSATVKSHSGSGAAGVGEIDVEWDGDFDELVSAIQQRKDRLPFDLDATSVTRDALTIRIKREVLASAAP